VDMLSPLLPRFYSIASSQLVVGDEIHLTVAGLRYNSNGHERFGVCTHYLCDLAPLNEAVISLYIQPHHGFTLPKEKEADIIMVGPGTGVAPFRGFMQERALHQGTGRNWLFFGERSYQEDYFYRHFWQDLETRSLLKVNTAFSRDQEHKIYVQHRMLEHGAEIFRWIDNGAYFYVCGDAQRMAKDVETTLLQIIQIYGSKTEQEAKEYLKKMRTDKKYLRDVY
jgi:sulfite reductase (NADPH) flavoprotein alpha-component